MTESESPKTVAVFNRAANKKYIENFAKNDAEIFLLEPPTAQPLETSSETSAILKNITDFDWLILTDIFASEILVEKLEQLEADLFELDKMRICAAGETVADRLRYRQIHADVVSSTNHATDVFESLKSYEDDLSQKKIMLPTERDTASKIGELLCAETQEVTKIPIYEIVFGDRENQTKTKIKLFGGAADEFIFSSPEEVFYLARIFGGENLAALVCETKMIALDPATYQTLREFGITNAVLNVGGYQKANKEK